jgi:hypothetical protein
MQSSIVDFPYSSEETKVVLWTFSSYLAAEIERKNFFKEAKADFAKKNFPVFAFDSGKFLTKINFHQGYHTPPFCF